MSNPAIQNHAAQTEALPLRDIHLPDVISWWPPAPGWWLLLGSLVLVAIIIFVIYKIHQRKRLQKTALAEFSIILDEYKQHNNKKTLAQSLSVLLRRASISFYPRSNVASLTGEQWLQHLDDTSDKKGFKAGNGHVLITAPYLPDDKNEGIDANSLISLCRSWLLSQPKKQLAGNQS